MWIHLFRFWCSVIFLVASTSAYALNPIDENLDLGLPKTPTSEQDKPADPNTRKKASVKQGITIQEAIFALDPKAGPVTVSTSSSVFVPLVKAGVDDLWKLSIDQPPGTFLSYKWAVVKTDKAGKVIGIERLYNSGLLGDGIPELTLAVPAKATHLEIATSKQSSVRLVPFKRGIDNSDKLVLGESRNLSFGKTFKETLDLPVKKSQDGSRQHLSAAMDLPLSWSAEVSFLVDGSWQRFKLEGGPRKTPAVEADADVQEVKVKVSRPDFFGKDPWPAMPITLAYEPVNVDEIEPNNQTDQASDAGWQPKDRRHRVQGRLAGEAPIDYWAFDVDADRAGKVLDFEVDGEGAGLKFALLDEEGFELLDLGGKDNLKIEDVVLQEGRYLITVAGKERDALYTLSFKQGREPREGVEVEPNSRAYLALPLEFGKQAKGQVADGDGDYYRVEVREGGKMWQAFASGKVNLTLYRGEKVIAYAKPGKGNRGVSTPQQPIPIGQYLIKVAGDDDYRLEFRQLGDRPEGYEREPNGDTASAEYLPIGGMLTGILSDSSDHDYAYFSVKQGRHLRLGIEAPDDTAMNVDIRFQGTQPFGGLSELKMARDEKLEQVMYFQPGDYVLSMQAKASVSQDLWKLTLVPVSPDALTEFEPNSKTAQRIYPGQRIQGNNLGFDGWDKYMMDLPAGPGQVVYACSTLIGNEYEAATASAKVLPRNIKDKYGKFGADNLTMVEYALPEPGSFVIAHRPYKAEVYDCAAHWLTPSTLGAAMAKASTNTAPYLPGEASQLGQLPTLIEGQFSEKGRRQKLQFVLPKAEKNRHVLINCSIGGINQDIRQADILFQKKGESLKHTFEAKDFEKGQTFQCGFVEIGDLAQLPISDVDGDSPAAEVKLSSGTQAPLAAYSDKRQTLDLELLVKGIPSRKYQITVSPSTVGWAVHGLPSEVVLETDVLRLPFKMVTPAFLTALEPTQIQVELRGRGALATSSLTIPTEPATTPVNVSNERAVLAPMAGGLNVAHIGLGGRVLMANGKPNERFETLIDGAAPRVKYQHHLTGKKKHQNAYIIDLAGEKPVPLVGLTYIQRYSDTWPPTSQPRLKAEFSSDGKTYTNPVVFELEYTRARQNLPLPEPIQATHVRITDPDCQKGDRYCLFVSELGVIAKPDWRPDLPPINLADPKLGGQVVAFSFDIYGADSPFWLLDPNKRTTYYGLITDSNPQPPNDGDFIIGFNKARMAHLAQVEWVDNPDTQGGNLPPTLDVFVDARNPFMPMKKVGTLQAPKKGKKSVLKLPVGTLARYVRFELPAGKGPRVLPDQIRVIEDAAGPNYQSVLGLWEEDSPLAFANEQAVGKVTLPVKAGGATREQAKPLPSKHNIASVTRKEDAPDWYKLPAQPGFSLKNKDHEVLRVVTMTAEQVVEVGARLFDGQTELPLQDWSQFLRSNPAFAKANPAFSQAMNERRDQLLIDHGDALLMVGEVQAKRDYVLKVAEEARLLVVRREVTDLLEDSEPERVRAFEQVADLLGDGKDALDAGRSADPLIRGKDNMLFALSQVKDPRKEARGRTSDFSEALASAANNLRSWPGGKSVVYFGMGGGMMQAEDMDWVYQMEEFPARTTSILAPCKPGNFFCPNPVQAETNPMHFAAAANGRFVRVNRKGDIRDAMLAATYAMFGPKSYGLDWQDYSVDIPVRAAQLTVSMQLEGETGAEEPPPAAGLSLILDGSGSMLKRVGDVRRIDAAKKTLLSLVKDTIPEGTPTTFRVFGLKRDGCETQARVPLAPLNRKQFARAIREVKAINLAKTPIASSLKAAAQDLAKHEGPKSLVLITDGEETCGGSVPAVLDDIKRAGIDVKLDIVGFAIDDKKLKREFEGWAKLGGGAYYDAQDNDALTDNLSDIVGRAVKAAPPQHAKLTVKSLLDPKQVPPTSINLNEATAVPAGSYVLEFADGTSKELELAEGQEVTVPYEWMPDVPADVPVKQP